MVKILPAKAGDARHMGSIPRLERSPGVGNANLLQYSCLENSMERGAWWVTVHGVAKTWTQLSVHIHMHACACIWERAHTHTHTHTHTRTSGTPVRGIIGLSMATENVMMNKS